MLRRRQLPRAEKEDNAVETDRVYEGRGEDGRFRSRDGAACGRVPRRFEHDT